LIAPLSVALLILVAGLAFNLHLQTRTEYPPPILDPEFQLWVSDPSVGSRPMVWDLDYVKGAGDQVKLQKATLFDRNALEMQLFQNGTDNKWVYVHLTQKIDGARLTALFDMEVSVWAFAEPSCACELVSNSQPVIFGIETNDETHVLTFIFSNTTYQPQQSPTHRTIILPTAPGEWTLHTINLAREYDNAQWKRPDNLSFMIIFEAPSSAEGWQTAYLHDFSWTMKSNITTARQGNQESTLMLGQRGEVELTNAKEIICEVVCRVAASCGGSSRTPPNSVTMV
jgi:hypothetical protein